MRNEANGIERATVSNAAGVFAIPAVQPGSYTVTITAEGFKPWTQKEIVFTQGDRRTLPNIMLEIGVTTAEVTVTAEAPLAPVDTGEKSETLNTKMINDLAIQGRNASELIKIMPGMAANMGLSQSQFNSQQVGSNSGPVGQYSANGMTPYGALTMISDGANLVDSGNAGTQIANVNQDMTAEIKVLTSNFGAEYAKGPATFEAVSKGGSSAFHGSGYFYARHAALNSWALGAQKPEEAKRLFRELVTRFPDEPGVHYAYGFYLLAADPAAALVEFGRELEHSPKHVYARLQIAFLELKRGNADAALKRAQEAAAFAPGNFMSHNAIGRALMAQGKTTDALAELEKAVKLAPDVAQTHFYLGAGLQAGGANRRRTQGARRVRAPHATTGPAQFSDRDAAGFSLGTGFRAAARDGSITSTVRPAGRFRSTCRMPLGQRISTSFAA